ARLGKNVIEERYGNLFQMYEQIINENPYETPMMIYPAVHYTMGGLWVDYELMTTVPGLYAIGECNFSDHGANRLGASALMQGLADGYFILPYTIGNYLSAEIHTKLIPTDAPEFIKAENDIKKQLDKLKNIKGKQSVDSIHKKFGKLMWEHCGMGRNEERLKLGLSLAPEIKKEFWNDLLIPGEMNEFNPEIEKASRVADFIELGELIMRDALQRKESCGGHFREEMQTEEGEAKRDDENFAFVSAWEYKGEDIEPEMHKEELTFEVAKPSQRSYK
ncbi:MAG TPA: FAD-binding protein, partial [Bacteroidales bacterium]|nr:FAD-binding protein [Bacteroidales bacterium]